MENASPSLNSRRTATANLQESLRLLDASFSSKEKSIFRISSNTPQKGKRASRRSDHYGSGDVGYRSHLKLHDLSITLGAEELTRTLLEDVSTGVLLREQESWKNATDRLYVEFLESLQAYGSEQQVFEVVADYIQTCSDAIQMFRDVDYKLAPKSVFLSKQEKWLVKERNTWRLVYCLYQNRISSHLVSAGRKPEEELMELSLHNPSEENVVQQLYKEDNTTRECQLVIDWLEQNALDQRNEIAHLKHFTDKTVAWENTLHQLQNQSDIAYRSSRAIVSRLDPDAPLRENRPLHDIDMEDESRLITEVFVHIRCGRMEEAQLLCVHTGQEWRAAALEGWRLYHDPNYDSRNTEGDKLIVRGNPNRDIWKLMAWQMAEDKRMAIFSRATFAALSGHLSALLTVCKTWEDMLWAYLRVIVDIRVEKEIRSNLLRQYIPLPESYWSNEMDIEDVFTEIEANKDVVQEEETYIFHKVQQYLILGHIGSLMEEMEQWIKSSLELEPQILRFFSHLVLFLRRIGQAEKEHIGDAILRTYVKELMQKRDPQLVAHYVATLPQEDQVTIYAEFLAGITESGERDLALAAAEDADLDIETITKTVVENIRNQESTSEPSVEGELSADDLMKVSALDWVVHYPSQRAEALWQANAIVRHFLAVSKLEAARMAFKKIPVDSIDLIIKQYHAKADSNINIDSSSVMQHIPNHVNCSIREFLCYKAYLDAEEGFSDWFEHFYHAKPTAPKLPAGEVPFTERVAFEHRSNQYKSELDRWKMAMQQQTKTVKSQLYNVLTFPEGGWLVDSVSSDTDDCVDIDDEEMSRRQKQMDNLRQLCIPKVTLLLHTIMHQMGEYEECIGLADLIVSEQHKLYKVFTKDRLAEILAKISMSSVALMDQKRDPWGCPVSS